MILNHQLNLAISEHMSIRIRKIKVSDFESIEKLLQQYYQVHTAGRPESFVPLEHPMSQDDFVCLISNEDIISILAEQNNKVVGICMASMLNKSGIVQMKTAYIDEIVVDESYRRKGVGRALFNETAKLAKRQGAKRIDLMVWSFNKGAIKAYRTYGMTPQRYIYEKWL